MADEIDNKISDLKKKEQKENLIATGAEIVAPELLPIISVAAKAKKAHDDAEIEKLEKQKQILEEEKEVVKESHREPHDFDIRHMAESTSGGMGGGPSNVNLGSTASLVWLIGIIGAVVVGFLSGRLAVFGVLLATAIGASYLSGGIRQALVIGLILLLFFGTLHIFWPRIAGVYEGGSIQIAFQNLINKIRGIDPAADLAAFTEEQKRIATGDYYTSEVEESKERELGLTMKSLETDIPTDQGIQEGEIFAVFTEVDVETIDPITLTLSCMTKDGALGTILQDTTYQVERSASELIDCEFEKLPAGTHTIQVGAEFDFATLAYVKSYFVDRNSLRALQSKEKDFFDTYNIGDNDPQSISSQGPISIGLGIGKPPIALGDTPRVLTLGITIINKYGGHVKEMKSLSLIVPKGFEVEQRGQRLTQRISCDDLSGVTQEACDETTQNVYSIDAGLKEGETIKRSKSYRVYLRTTSPNEVLGAGPYAVHNFKVTADYVYQLQQERTIFIKPKEELLEI